MFEDCRDSTLVGIHLHIRPGIVVRKPGVFGLDSDETRVAGFNAFPYAWARVKRFSGSHDEKRPVASKAKLSQRARKVRPPVRDNAQTGHVPVLWSGSVMADDAADRSDVAVSTHAPARLFRHLEAGVLDHFGQPGQRKRHVTRLHL